MGEAGFFVGERLELISGIIVEMTPVGPLHVDVLDELTRILVPALEGRARVRIQQPYAAGEDTEPEPDLAVVPLGRYAKQHPTQAHLVIEVARSSLDYDRETKAPIYAQSGVAGYWIVDVDARVIEVYRQPIDGVYRRVERVARSTIAAFSDIEVIAATLFVDDD